MDNCGFSPPIFNEIRLIAELQRRIINLTESNVTGTCAWVADFLNRTPPGLDHLEIFVRVLLKSIVVRPKSLSLFTDFFISFSGLMPDSSVLVSLLLSKFLLNAERFILSLLQRRFLTPMAVINTLKPLFSEKERLSDYISLFAFFSPEIEAIIPAQIDYLIAEIPALLEREDIPVYEKAFLLGYSALRENHWALLNERRFHTYEFDALERFILEDDVASFSQFCNEDEELSSRMIPHTIFTSTVFPFCDATVPQFCAFHGAVRCLKYLITQDHDVRSPNANGLTIGHFAIAGGSPDVIQLLTNARIPFPDDLQCAAKFFRTDLVMSRCTPEKMTMSSDQFDSLLNCAVSDFNLDVLLFCLRQGASITAAGNLGNQPIHAAILESPPEMTLFLLGHRDIDINARSFYGDTPVFLATQLDEAQILERLLANRRLRVEPDGMERNLLHIAATTGSLRSLDVLINARRFDLNGTDRFGQTPLHLAVLRQSIECVRLLCGNIGVDLNVADLHGRTPLHFAKEGANREIIAIIENRLRIDDDSSDPEDSSDDDEEDEEDEEEEEEEEENEPV
jgi:ankyrin repeat protein